MGKYDRFRYGSARKLGRDYGSNGFYFITISVKNNYHSFGKIIRLSEYDTNPENYILEPTEIGKVAHNNWLQIPEKIHL